MKQIMERYDTSLEIKLNDFEKHVGRHSISRFLARYELFKLQLGIKGCIIEYGVHHRGGVMA